MYVYRRRTQKDVRVCAFGFKKKKSVKPPFCGGVSGEWQKYNVSRGKAGNMN